MSNITIISDLSILTEHSLLHLFVNNNSFTCDCDSAWLYDIISDSTDVVVYLDERPCLGLLADMVWSQMQRLNFCDTGRS